MIKDQKYTNFGICWEEKNNNIIVECIMKDKFYSKKCNITNEIIIKKWKGCNGKICVDCYDRLKNINKCPFCNIENYDINEHNVNRQIIVQHVRYPNYLKKLQMLTIMISILLFLIVFVIFNITNNYINDKHIIFVSFCIIITNIISIILDTIPNVIYLF